jgi:2-methylisocitrate lyase-like PEP mutase family enzyme
MDKGQTFRQLHDATFVMPNPSEPGTARLLQHLGFRAIATSSAGYAFTRALPDGGVGFEEMIAHCRDMVAAVDIPVSADLEKGKGDSADSAAETVFAAEAAGLAGCSIEDYSGDDSMPIYEFEHAVDRVRAAAQAARALKRDFVFTARTENFLPEMLKTICRAVGKPVSMIAPKDQSVAALAAIGIRRISTGPRLTQAMFGAVEKAAREMLDRGTFTFISDVAPFGPLQTLFSAK